MYSVEGNYILRQKKDNVNKFAAAFAELNGNTLPRGTKVHITYGGP